VKYKFRKKKKRARFLFEGQSAAQKREKFRHTKKGNRDPIVMKKNWGMSAD